MLAREAEHQVGVERLCESRIGHGGGQAVGGEVRLGSIRLEAPPGRARVSDYLNALTSRFLTLYTSNEARLINRSLIDRVRPLD